MANDEIKDVANTIELGDNLGENADLYEDAFPGHLMYWVDADSVAKYPANDIQPLAGVLDTKYDHDLGSAISSGVAVHVTNEGWVAAWIDNPGGTKYRGTELFRPKSTAGVLSFTASGAEAPLAKLAADVASGDTVARIKLLRGG